jgi:hypothetical protein
MDKLKKKDAIYYMDKMPIEIDAPPAFKANQNNVLNKGATMKFIALIQQEFLKMARKWEDIPYDLQKAYLGRHPGSSRRITAQPPPKSPTSGLAIHEPKRSQSHGILDMLRDAVKASTPNPVWRSYITKREGTANKYHYLAVFPTESGEYASANVWGRIGYPPKGVKVLALSSSLAEAKGAAEEKMERKMRTRGYKPTSLPA